MKVIGITGGIGTGKSTVTQILRKSGLPVICADECAKEVVEQGSPTLEKIIKLFGHEYKTSTGELDRKKLGTLVFQNPEKLRQLNAIIHPVVQSLMKQKINEYKRINTAILFLDIPLLFESKLEHLCNQVVVVSTPKEIQLQRINKRDSLPTQEIENRLASQMPLSEKEKRAHYIIENSSTLDNLEKEVIVLIDKLKHQTGSQVNEEA